MTGDVAPPPRPVGPPQADPDAPPPKPVPTPDGAELRTFLIADIRGYSAYTEEHGSDAAAELAGQFATIVREVVEVRDGFLLELRGDEALVVFVLARRALRAAVELQARFAAELPRGVGIGLDAGEAIPVEGGYRGSALNVAARLCGQAGPGETIASETVIRLAARMDGVDYLDPKTFRLKGLDEPVRAMHVVGADAARARRAHGSRRDRRPDRRLLAVGGIGLVALALAAVGLSGVLGSGVGPGASPSGAGASPGSSAAASPGSSAALVGAQPQTAVLLDPTTGQIAKTVGPFREPAEAEYTDGSFWLLDLNPTAIHIIDAETGAEGISTPIAFDAGGFARDGETMWASDHVTTDLHKLDLRTGREVETYSLGSDIGDFGSGGIAFGEGSVWVAHGDWVLRVDPSNGKVVGRIHGANAFLIVIGDGSVWTLGWDGTVSRIDPSTDTIVAKKKVPNGMHKIVAGGGYAWLSNPDAGLVYQVDQAIDITGTHPTGDGVEFIDYDDSTDTLWAGNYNDRSVSAVDGVTGRVRTFDVGYAVQPVAAGDGHLLVGLHRTPEDVVAGLPGTVVTLTTDESFDTNDPALGFRSESRWQLDDATCARLLDYPDPSGDADSELEPEVAASMPTVSDGGRTYTFTVRPGFAFSPPSNEPVTAETYRYSIERALSGTLGGGADGYAFLSDVVGAREFHGGSASHVDGLAAAGDQLTIRLGSPSPTFLRRLWMPQFCPVPLDTPILQGGQNDPPIARAGPYYISQHFNGEVTILERNPNYGGTRKPKIDAFAWYVSQNLGREVGRVEQDERDYTAGFGAELQPGGRIDSMWGPSAAATAGGQRLFLPPLSATEYLVLDTRSEALSDPDVRRAIGLALDRPALSQPWTELPTDEIVPATLPGVVAADRYPLDGPRLDEARTLMAGRQLTVRLLWWDSTDDPKAGATADAIVSQLKAIGISVEVTDVPRGSNPATEAAKPDATADMIAGSTFVEYPDTADWLGAAIGPNGIPAAWLPSYALGDYLAAQAMSGAARDAAAAALAARLQDDSVFIATGQVIYPQFVSSRVGCVTFPPHLAEVDLAALCLKPGT